MAGRHPWIPAALLAQYGGLTGFRNFVRDGRLVFNTARQVWQEARLPTVQEFDRTMDAASRVATRTVAGATAINAALIGATAPLLGDEPTQLIAGASPPPPPSAGPRYLSTGRLMPESEAAQARRLMDEYQVPDQTAARDQEANLVNAAATLLQAIPIVKNLGKSGGSMMPLLEDARKLFPAILKRTKYRPQLGDLPAFNLPSVSRSQPVMPDSSLHGSYQPKVWDLDPNVALRIEQKRKRAEALLSQSKHKRLRRERQDVVRANARDLMVRLGGVPGRDLTPEDFRRLNVYRVLELMDLPFDLMRVPQHWLEKLTNGKGQSRQGRWNLYAFLHANGVKPSDAFKIILLDDAPLSPHQPTYRQLDYKADKDLQNFKNKHREMETQGNIFDVNEGRVLPPRM